MLNGLGLNGAFVTTAGVVEVEEISIFDSAARTSVVIAAVRLALRFALRESGFEVD